MAEWTAVKILEQYNGFLTREIRKRFYEYSDQDIRSLIHRIAYELNDKKIKGQHGVNSEKSFLREVVRNKYARYIDNLERDKKEFAPEDTEEPRSGWRKGQKEYSSFSRTLEGNIFKLQKAKHRDSSETPLASPSRENVLSKEEITFSEDDNWEYLGLRGWFIKDYKWGPYKEKRKRKESLKEIFNELDKYKIDYSKITNVEILKFVVFSSRDDIKKVVKKVLNINDVQLKGRLQRARDKLVEFYDEHEGEIFIKKQNKLFSNNIIKKKGHFINTRKGKSTDIKKVKKQEEKHKDRIVHYYSGVSDGDESKDNGARTYLKDREETEYRDQIARKALEEGEEIV